MIPDETVIWTRDLAKDYGSTPALQELTMEVQKGEVLGFLGPNGAGKTTTVKILLGLARPTAGDGRLLGLPLGSVSARRHLGYLPELFRYQDWLTAAEVLEYHAGLLGIPGGERTRERERVLDLVGLPGKARLRVGALSKGMTQRLGLGVALLGRPELLVLDEPTSALDPVGCHDVRTLIRSLRDEGVTVFLNSHLLAEVEQVADRVVMLDRGRAVAQGRLTEVLRRRGVRIRVEGLQADRLSAIEATGPLCLEEGWIVASEAEERDIPALVAAIVGEGARIYTVEPMHETLESRFLGWLEGGRPL